MKIAYVYPCKLAEREANINQMLNMASSMARSTELTLLSCWISKTDYRKTLNFFSVDANFRLFRLPVSLVTSGFLLEKLTRLIYCALALLHIMLGRYDVIYTRDFSFLLFISYLPRILRPRQKIVYEVHKIYYISSVQKVSAEIERRALEHADWLLPITHGVSDDLVRLFAIDESRMAVVESGVNLANFQRPESDASRSGIIYSGSFLEWKGVDVLLKAVKYLRSKDFEVAVVGGTGVELEEMAQLAKSEGVAECVSVEGRMSQQALVPRILASGIGVLPNTQSPIGEKYTSPLKLFEYLACGVAIVAADLPSMREILVEGENALFFEPSDERQLAQCLDRLLREDELRAHMQQNNAAKARCYGWDRRAERVLSLLA